MQKHLKNANNFKLSTGNFNFKRDKKWNEQLNRHLGMASVYAEMLETRVKKGQIKKKKQGIKITKKKQLRKEGIPIASFPKIRTKIYRTKRASQEWNRYEKKGSKNKKID